MAKGHLCMALLALVICTAGVGCAVYSEQNYGPQDIGGVATLTDCLKRAGGPDLMHQAGGRTVCVYRSIEAKQIMGVYAQVKKRDHVFVFRADGTQESYDVVGKGEGVTIIGGLMVPAIETE